MEGANGRGMGGEAQAAGRRRRQMRLWGGGGVIRRVSSGWREREREKVDRRAAVRHQSEFCGILHQRAGEDVLCLHTTYTLIQ